MGEQMAPAIAAFEALSSNPVHVKSRPD